MNDPQTPENQTPSRPASTGFTGGRIGKVARLPKSIRDKISQLMLDGRTYLQIIAELGEEGESLTEDNLGTWKSSGYLEYRRDEKEMADMRFRHEYAADLARETEGTSLCEATSKMLLAQILDALRDAGPGSLQSALADKPEIYVRLAHAVARISVGAIACERQRLNEAQRKAQMDKENADPADRSISSETVSTVDELLRTQ